MKKLILAVAVTAAFTGSFAQAQEAAAPAPAADAAPAAAPFTGNMTIASNYIFRGLTQTFAGPTIQGGFDYVSPTGFYVGNWDSNVSGVSYNNGSGTEMDFYGGYRFEPVKDLGLDVGAYYYYYPSAVYQSTVGTTQTKYNNGEVYIAATYQWFAAKYSYGVTDFFGLNSNTAPVANGDSKGSGYLDLSGNFTVADKTTLTVHVGHQTVHDYSGYDYTDYKVGIAKDFGFATLGLAVTATDADRSLYTISNGVSTKYQGATAAILSISKTF